MRLGLLGYPLGHSFSKQYFEKKFADLGLQSHYYDFFAYKNLSDFFEILPDLSDLRGFNVTIPHKTAIIPFLDRLDAMAAAVGAVNTVCRVGNEWVGYNTDVIGFEKNLLFSFEKKPLNFFENKENVQTRFFVLGDGGASKAVQYILQKYNLPYNVVSRQAQKTATASDFNTQNIDFFVKNRLISYDFFDFYIKNRQKYLQTDSFLTIINTTPLGTAPNISEKPEIAYNCIKKQDILIDLVYNPPQTAFLLEGVAQKCFTQNGQMMLEEQAEAAWFIWNG
jgi:shikimate dehydrogenase